MRLIGKQAGHLEQRRDLDPPTGKPSVASGAGGQPSNVIETASLPGGTRRRHWDEKHRPVNHLGPRRRRCHGDSQATGQCRAGVTPISFLVSEDDLTHRALVLGGRDARHRRPTARVRQQPGVGGERRA
nr:hypothetical protein [Micromonospora sp. DSM 115978]